MELIELYAASDSLDRAAAIVAQLQQADPTNAAVLYTAYRIYSDLAGQSLLNLSLVSPDSAQMHEAMAHEDARQTIMRQRLNNTARHWLSIRQFRDFTSSSRSCCRIYQTRNRKPSGTTISCGIEV